MNSTNNLSHRRAQRLLREGAGLVVLTVLLEGGLWAFPSSRLCWIAALSATLPLLILRGWQILSCLVSHRAWMRTARLHLLLLGTSALSIIVLCHDLPWLLLVQFVLLILCGIGLLHFRLRLFFLLICNLIAAYFVVYH